MDELLRAEGVEPFSSKDSRHNVKLYGYEMNMKKGCYLILSLFLFIGCGKKESTFYYSIYGKDDILIEKNAYIQTLTKIKGDEYELKISGNKYNEGFKTKIDSTGIYRFCNDHYALTHHFDSIENQEFCKTSTPFIYKNVYWVRAKKYFVRNKTFEIICFGEDSSSSEYMSSYYLKGFGFICYYFYEVDKYVLCDSIKSVKFDLPTLHEINHLLVHDTTIFERYVVKYPKIKFLPPP